MHYYIFTPQTIVIYLPIFSFLMGTTEILQQFFQGIIYWLMLWAPFLAGLDVMSGFKLYLELWLLVLLKQIRSSRAKVCELWSIFTLQYSFFSVIIFLMMLSTLILSFAGKTSGTAATFVIIDGLTVTVASVGDSRCVLVSSSPFIITHQCFVVVIVFKLHLLPMGWTEPAISLSWPNEFCLITMQSYDLQIFIWVVWFFFAISFIDWSSPLLARRLMPFEINWGHGCGWIYRSNTICKAS